MGFDIEKSFIMAERLKQLREEKGLSHEKLSKALFDQYGVKISSDSLINYEVADAGHTKAYKNQGMRVEYLRCLADFYGVSADYILGQINDPCRIPSAIDELGLSEKAVKWLAEIQSLKRRDIIWNMNPVFENSFFQCLVYSLTDYMDAARAEEIYMQLHDQFFDYSQEYSKEEGEAIREQFEQAVMEAAESKRYTPQVRSHLRANLQLWGRETASPDLVNIIESAAGITEISAYAANKYLVKLLSSLHEEVKEEIGSELAAKAEG